MNTERLIQTLAADLPPVRRLASPGRRLGQWLAFALPVLAATVAFAGLRPDLAACLNDPRFVIGALAALATGLAAAWAALASTVPGRPGRDLTAPLAPAALWLASAGEGCWQEWQASGWTNLASLLEQKCLPEILATGLVPGLALALLARRGAILAPALTAALAALAAAACASAAMTLFHHGDTAWVTLGWHLGGSAATSAAAALAAPLLFRRRARFPPA